MGRTETIRQSRLRSIIELFDFFEYNDYDRLGYITGYCGGESTLKNAKNSDLKDLLDFLSEKKGNLFKQLKAAAIKAGIVQKDNASLMNTWEIDKLLREQYGVALRDARASHIRKIIHLLQTGEIL